MTDRIEAQIERFAPGFRDLILAKSVRTAAEMEQHYPNYIGGDISGASRPADGEPGLACVTAGGRAGAHSCPGMAPGP